MYSVYMLCCETTFCLVVMAATKLLNHNDSFLYSLNWVYFTLTFIFNSVRLMAVASSIFEIKTFVQEQLEARNSMLRAEAEGEPREVQ